MNETTDFLDRSDTLGSESSDSGGLGLKTRNPLETQNMIPKGGCFNMESMAREQQLDFESDDTISSAKFSPHEPNHLLISSWDSSLTLMDVLKNRILMRTVHSEPLLDSCFGINNVFAFSGSLSGHARIHNLERSGNSFIIGKHGSAIASVAFSRELRAVLTGSWDASVQIWDPRTQGPVTKMNQFERVYTMSLVSDAGAQLLVGTAGRKLLLWDLRSNSILQRRESSLKYQTRVVACFPNGDGFALGSIEGRIGYEFFDFSSEAQRRKYAFKCHRIKDEATDEELIFPVNSISFHPRNNVFASGGSDGFVSIWDGVKKKRLCQLHRFRHPITCVDFSKDGKQLAVASSQFYSVNPNEIQSGRVHVRWLSEREFGC